MTNTTGPMTTCQRCGTIIVKPRKLCDVCRLLPEPAGVPGEIITTVMGHFCEECHALCQVKGNCYRCNCKHVGRSKRPPDFPECWIPVVVQIRRRHEILEDPEPC